MENWKSSSDQQKKRVQLASEIKGLRKESLDAKQSNEIRFMTPEEIIEIEERYRYFPIVKRFREKIESQKLNGIKVSEERPKQIDEEIRTKLEIYYNELLDNIFPKVDGNTLDFVYQLQSQVPETKKQIPVLVYKFTSLLRYLSKTNLEFHLINSFNRVYEKYIDQISSVKFRQNIRLPDKPKNIAREGYRLGDEGNKLMAALFLEYQRELYQFFLNSKINKLQTSQNYINNSSSTSQIKNVTKKLIKSITFLKDKDARSKFQHIIEKRPEILEIDSYDSELLVAAVFYGSKPQLDILKSNALKAFTIDGKNKIFVKRFFENLIYTTFDLELQGFNFRSKVIDFICSIMQTDTDTATIYFYKWLGCRSLVSEYGSRSNLGSELYKYLEIQKANPNLPKILAQKFNIYCLGRYPISLLENLVKAIEDKEKPYILSVVASNDHSGTFDDIGSGLSKILDQLRNLGNLLITEAGSYTNIIEILKQLHEDGFKPPSILLISAHGDQDSFYLGDNNRGEVTTKNINNSILKPLLGYLKRNNITVILESCSTGQGQNSLQKNALDHEISIIAPDDTINRGTQLELIVDNGKIKVIKVIYTNRSRENGQIIAYPPDLSPG